MKFTLPKNRTAPLIIFAVFSIIVWLLLGLYHLEKVTQYSNKTKLETYDSLTQNVASLLRQEIENNYQSLQVSANLVAKSGNLDKSNIESLLPLFSNDTSYIDLAIVGINGIGYNKNGEIINVADETYFLNTKKGLMGVADGITFTEDNIPVINFAAPIIDNNNYKGAMLVKVRAQISNLAPFQSEMEEGSLIYLVNSNNELISYIQDTDVNEFDYNNMVSNGYFHITGEVIDTNIDIGNLFFEEKSNDNTYIWDKKPLGINDWYVLIGRPNVINPTTRDILRLTNMMWIGIILVTFILFMFFIYMQRRANKKVVEMVYIDPVTGGGNWYKFRMNVYKILNSKQYGKKSYVMINFDINRFKIINDAYGYQKGDEVLKDIYGIIKNWVKPGEPFTRYAADQFFILLSYQNEAEIKLRIYELNDQLHQLNHTRTAKIFYGVYFITDNKYSIDRMGEFASIAKNNIKGSAEGIISYFDDAAKGKLLKEEEIEKTMNEALKNEEFHVFLQPKYKAKEESLSGAEALVRWFSTNGSIISPGHFIPVFEKNGFITELDYYMLRKICEIIRGWIDKGYTPLPISVNISRLHFANPQLADIIKDIVDQYEVPHNLIELELTESAFLQNKQTLINTVIQLRKYGFLISMDDFGAGYSSLNALKDLPLDVVKLDGELFRMTNEVERGLTVIRNTITMAKDLHMQVVAECIETREQVEFLCNVGCDMIQGYYFAKPMPVDQFEEKYYPAID